MNLRKLYYLLLILPILFLNSACSEEDSTAPPTEDPVNEAQVLLDYLEADMGDFINTAAPAMIAASDVYTNLGANQYVIDIRSAADYAAGHIEGAVNVTLTGLVDHVDGVSKTGAYDKIVIACYSGQTAGFATAVLRFLGYNNVYDLKWGMSSWHDNCAPKWLSNIGNNYTDFVTTATAKNAAGELPALSTGKTTGAEILNARIDALMSTANPFGDAAISYSAVTADLDSYYIVNYWSADQYNLGHLSGAVQYTPKADLKSSTFINTLPTDKTIVVYCYTGQTSAHVTAFLRLLGYDAKSLLYGVNTMNYDWMVGHSMTHFDESYVMNYPLVD
ncbi:MAG: hypothetical protein K9J16_01155 [Melioribacteraceae bacterium]|nr:hypothetical protein [Melioribacteraceae bacterium]MCF8356169.1 hypothetical protein [Melioribacteraceae bacterium]MCF8392335.1 hypothetical protein [Melioribacteraceae bacterium]MCF8417667.1 hypothetical protein [Melioribacteraceae bacterium]